MTMSSWLMSVFWRAFRNWIEKDPEAAAERIAAIMEGMIEDIVTSQEEAMAEEPTTPAVQ